MKRYTFLIMTALIVSALLSFSEMSLAQKGKWRKRTDMLTPRAGLATCAVNGRVYAIGGSGRDVGSASAVEAYNPLNNRWQRRTKMPTPKLHVSASVVDRKIYVIGGAVLQGRMEVPNSTVEVYDPALDMWVKKANTPTLRFSHATSAVNGKIYAIGGRSGQPRREMVATVEVYDPLADTWTKRKDMPTPRAGLATCAVNGKIYAIGGLNGDGDLSTVEIYDPRRDQWTKGADMPTPRHGLSTNVIDGKIYAIGGGNWEGHKYIVVPVIEIYDPKANKWTKGPDIPSDWVSFSTVELNGRIYVIGGSEVGSIIRNGRVWTFFTTGDFGKMLEFDTGFRSVLAFGKKPMLWGMLKAARN